ncbi:MAG: IS200/IS605 family element transposase accessory protein TnpB [Bacteroidetes bacterium]|nr:IS200/IS605 family element transposase accessory protein TnpB [Bacteroidota bacterium]
MRAQKSKVKGLTKPQFKRLKALTGHAKNLYNQALWTLREAYLATGNYFSYPKMDKAMKQIENLEGEVNYRLLKAKVAQQTLRRLDKNFKAFFKANQDFKNHPQKYKGQPRPPKFKRVKHDNLISRFEFFFKKLKPRNDYQCFQVKNRVCVTKEPQIVFVKRPNWKVFPMGQFVLFEQVVILEKGLEIKVPNQLWDKEIKQIEIIPKYNCFYAVFVYEENSNDFKPVNQNDQVMSIDLGLNNLATCVTNGVVEPFIIDGRRLKSINAHYNKRKASMQSKLSERGKKWSLMLQNLTDWRNAVVNDYMHKATSIVVKTCVKHGISKVVVGDVVKSLNRINLGKRTNQNFVNLALGQFVDKLGYKLGSHGIELVVTDECYTSKASFVDGDKMPKRYNPKAKQKRTFSGKRVKRGLYKSGDGTLINADVNGAFNILRKTDSDFSFSKLAKKVGARIKEWLHPSKRIRPLPTKKEQFWLTLKPKCDLSPH